MSPAEARIREIATSYLDLVSRNWRGHEIALAIELVRGLDEIAFAFSLAPNSSELAENDVARQHMLRGGALALGPLLEAAHTGCNDIPWGPTTDRFSELADDHLRDCGVLSVLMRLCGLERYDLAETKFLASDHLVIEVAAGSGERSEVEAETWLRGFKSCSSCRNGEKITGSNGIHRMPHRCAVARGCC
jgi:hypothetical protein